MIDRPAETSGDAKRARIVRAAREVCARRGFDAARMEEIAAVARVSKGTLYRFFRSKEDLFLATVLDSYEAAHRIVSAHSPPAGPPRQRLAALLQAMARALPTVSAQMPVNFQAWGVVARDARARRRLAVALRTVYAERSAELETVFRAGQRSGTFRAEIDPEAFAAAVLAIFDGLLYRSTFDPHHANAGRLQAAFATLVEPLLADASTTREPEEALPGG